MTIIKQFSKTYPTVSAVELNSTYEQFVWVGFQPEDGVCHLQKTSIYDLNSVYYDIELTVNAILDIKVVGTYVYVLHDITSSILASYFAIANPLVDAYELAFPRVLQENPVAVGANSNEGVFVLLPGSLSSLNSSILYFNSNGVFVEEIDLGESSTVVNDASSMIIDDNDVIWITTNTIPANLVKVWYDGALSIWRYVVTQMTP